MNWGYKILTVYIVFIAGILFLVFKSSNENQDLVTTDYYEQELKYQERIDETKRADALSGEVTYTLNNRDLTLSFPEEMKGKSLTAQVLLYCIANKKRDISYNLNTGTATTSFAIPEINKGLHDLKINWEVNGTTYYNEFKIMIP